MTARVRIISPHSTFRGSEGDVVNHHPDGAVSVRLDGEKGPAMTFYADEVEELADDTLESQYAGLGRMEP